MLSLIIADLGTRGYGVGLDVLENNPVSAISGSNGLGGVKNLPVGGSSLAAGG
jgi:hypothetical protein